MLNKFTQGREYKVLDWKTLIVMEGVQRYQDACGYDWVCYKNNHYSKQHIDDIEGLQFVADELEYQNYDELVIQPWICEELLPEFVVGKQYEILGLEDIKKIPGIQVQNGDEYFINEESDQYLSDMDKYKGTVFTAKSPTYYSISCWNIEPWMCKEVSILKRFEVGKTYQLLNLEKIKQLPGVEPDEDGDYIFKNGGAEYTRSMVQLGGTQFTPDNNEIWYLEGWTIEPWMCEEVKTVEKVEVAKKVKEETVEPTSVDKKVRELTLLYLQKNHDYGNSVGITRAVLGENSDLVRMADKINRIKTLQENEGFVSEKVEDTIFDLVNYYAIYKASQSDDTLMMFVTFLENTLLNPETMLDNLEKELSTIILDERTSNFIKEFITANC